MNVLQRIRSLLVPVVGSGFAVSMSGAICMFTAVKYAVPTYFHLGVAMLVVGCLVSAYGGYLVGRSSSAA